MTTSGRFRVMRFRATCAACAHTWANPLLSDQQSYGEFILYGERGDVFAYLNAFDGPAWDTIVALVASVAGPIPKRNWDAAVDRLQRVIAACADPVDGERLTMSIICPNCQSTDVRYGDADPMGLTELPMVSFEHFMGLSDSERLALVRALIDSTGKSA